MWYVSVWICGVLRYLRSIAILATKRDQTTHLALRSLILAILNSRQPNLWLYDLCPNCARYWFAPVLGKGILLTLNIVAVGTMLNVFSLDTVSGRDSKPLPITWQQATVAGIIFSRVAWLLIKSRFSSCHEILFQHFHGFPERKETIWSYLIFLWKKTLEISLHFGANN